MLTTGDYPILDHDDDPTDFVSSLSQHTGRGAVPSTVVLAILGEKVASYAQESGADDLGAVNMITTCYPIWGLSRAGSRIGLVECPIGAPAATMVAEDLIVRGAKNLILVGSCGALTGGGEGEFLIPDAALRDEGTSYHYLPPARWVDTDPLVNLTCTQVLEASGLKARQVRTWTTDGFHRETPAIILARRNEGCEVVEMECAALAACAHFRGVRFGQILFTADSLASEVYQPRGWGVDTHLAALDLGVTAALVIARAVATGQWV